MRRKRGCTTVDIARALGVSTMSVSRALRGIEGVSESTRSAILRMAEAMNYVPDSTARALSQPCSNLIGISVPTLFNDVFAEILEGMRSTFQSAGYETVIDTTDYSPAAELAWVERVLSWRPAAMILTGAHSDPQLRDCLKVRGVPTLELWQYTDDPIDICVGIDHYAAGLAIGRHVFRLGYRRPAFVGAPEFRDPRAEERLAGFMAAFGTTSRREASIARPVETNAFEAGRTGTLTLLAESIEYKPDVIFYLNDHLAFGGSTACQALGLQIPRDIGVVGFNALGLTKVLSVPITTVSTPRRLMGVMGARNLLARIRGSRVPSSICLPVEVIAGATTRLQF
ncbi:LacI family DNA-binding transcriptional regulator [Rhizobium sullae]|uniref:LacI family DNA-binding transcriptional regulator n=1 Tax=Rhizobium sullae TaxID=50338 RepID=UPI001048E08D|nr:LacI family DNA-binding transcriptional regulator [Rhizobium sullae]